MAARVVSVAFEGVEARRVDVEVQRVGGLNAFIVVGLAAKVRISLIVGARFARWRAPISRYRGRFGA